MEQQPLHEFRMRRRIEFADTDMGGIVHFSRFFVFMETTEHRFLEALGSSVSLRRDGRDIGWPRVAASCEYTSPARFGDELEMHLRVVRKGTKSISYRCEFRVGDRRIAEGRISSVCCVLESGGVRSIPIPDEIASRIAVSPE